MDSPSDGFLTVIYAHTWFGGLCQVLRCARFLARSKIVLRSRVFAALAASSSVMRLASSSVRWARQSVMPVSSRA